MAHETSKRRSTPVGFPPELDEWLEARADDAGVDRSELLVQLAATYRAAAEDGDAASALLRSVETAAADAADERVDDRLESFRSSLDPQLQTIRKRVVQLKRESDEKAETARLEEVSRRVRKLESSVEELEDGLEEVRTVATGAEPATSSSARDETERMVDPGATSELEDRLEDVESKLVRVARAVVELRDRKSGATTDAPVAREGTFRAIRRAVAREGVREAPCANCGKAVDLALLPDPVCPHCDATFEGLTRDSAFEELRLETVDDHPASGAGSAPGGDAGMGEPPEDGEEADG